VTLGNPLQKGIEKSGPNCELLFAGAYSACYHDGLGNAAKQFGIHLENSTVRAWVSLIEEDLGGYSLRVELHAQLPGTGRAQTKNIIGAAYQTYPYSKALRGGASVTLVADEPSKSDAV
jgi:Ohr subfamily peroxiredoxin